MLCPDTNARSVDWCTAPVLLMTVHITFRGRHSVLKFSPGHSSCITVPCIAVQTILKCVCCCCLTGSWSRSSGETGKANDAGQGPGGPSAAAAARLSSAGSGPGRAASHRPSSSFSGFMDPSGLNIIEDYALQANDSALPQLPEEQSTAGSSPVTSEGGPFTALAAGKSAAAAAAAERQGSTATAEGLRSNSPARSGSPGKGAGRSSSPCKMKLAGSSKKSVSETESDAEARQPLLSSAASRNGSLDLSSSQAGSTPQKQGPGQGTSRPTTPVPGDDASTPPLLASSSPIVVSGSRQQQQQAAMRSSKSVSFSQSPEATDPSSSGHGPLIGSHSAAAILAGTAGLAKSAGGVADSPGGRMHSVSPLARRSASPLLYGGTSSSPPEPGLGRASSSYEPLPVGSGCGYVCAVEPGQEDEDEVLVEVFEHERVQPFRGWGHTWPGGWHCWEGVCLGERGGAGMFDGERRAGAPEDPAYSM
jgi:hypothetical protein